MIKGLETDDSILVVTGIYMGELVLHTRGSHYVARCVMMAVLRNS